MKGNQTHVDLDERSDFTVTDFAPETFHPNISKNPIMNSSARLTGWTTCAHVIASNPFKPPTERLASRQHAET